MSFKKNEELVAFLPFIMFANHDDEPDINNLYPYPECKCSAILLLFLNIIFSKILL